MPLPYDSHSEYTFRTARSWLSLMIGRTIAHYEVLELIGKGGMGVVYKARDTRLKRFVALKILPAEKISDPVRKQRFMHEARSASALNHPNIVTVYDIGVAEGMDFIAMEYVEGQTLQSLIGHKGLKLGDALRIAIQVADALATAHAASLVHRDLKPGNIMVTGGASSGRAKVLDFGLAKLAESAPLGNDEDTRSITIQQPTRVGVILGTIGYMSPEQSEGKNVDTRSDIFAFGAMLYEMLTGRRAFRRDNPALTLAAVAYMDPPPLPEEVPYDVQKLIGRCLRKDPARRCQTMADVKVALEDLKEDCDAGGVGPGPRRPPAPRRWPNMIAFAALGLLLGFGAYRWISAHFAVPFTGMEITRLTDTGLANAAAISPDGKYVAHAVLDGDMSSLLLLNAATGGSVPMLAPAQGTFSNLAFSHDGNSLYYVFSNSSSQTLYAIPAPSGNPRKLASFGGVETASLSRDEKQLVFIRTVGPESSVSISNLDGGEPRRVASHQFPEQIQAGAAWSPDGATLAYPVASFHGGFSNRLMAAPAHGGAERQIGTRTWFNISQAQWTSDGRALIVVASERLTDPAQLWHVSYPSGETRRITNDLNDYSGLALTADSHGLVTVQAESDGRVWVMPSRGAAAPPREIAGRLRTSILFLDWAGNDNVVYSAPDSQQHWQLWTAAADGSSRRQITEEGPADVMPSSCGDGRRMVFLSFRGGNGHIWRYDADAGSAQQLTNGDSEFGPSCAPDGTWFTYGSLDPNRYGVWRMPIEGGSASRIYNEYGFTSISPDGKYVVVDEFYAKRRRAEVVPAGGGAAIASFALGRDPWRWSADGKSLLFRKTAGGISNLWRQPLNGGPAAPLTNFQSERISDMAESPDGKRLAVARYSTSSDVVMIRDLK